MPIGPKEAQLRALRLAKAAAVKPKAEKLAVANAAVNNVINTPHPTAYFGALHDAVGPTSGPAVPGKSRRLNADRQAKWREANPDTNRKRARDGMKKKRAGANG